MKSLIWWMLDIKGSDDQKSRLCIVYRSQMCYNQIKVSSITYKKFYFVDPFIYNFSASETWTLCWCIRFSIHLELSVKSQIIICWWSLFTFRWKMLNGHIHGEFLLMCLSNVICNGRKNCNGKNSKIERRKFKI